MDDEPNLAPEHLISEGTKARSHQFVASNWFGSRCPRMTITDAIRHFAGMIGDEEASSRH